MTKLPERYDAKTREKFWQNYWREKKIFAWKNDLPKEKTFVIDTPPPTVSGLLHMGHVFSYTQADFVARFQRMSGKDVFYPMGFDDNGLPTERLVEKIIGKKAGIFEHENGHGSFVKKCREVVDEAEKEFEALFNEVALSVDWEQKYQTISPESQKISQASFLDLYNKGFAEKMEEPVFWDVSDRTALAQADLIDKEVEGVMNEIEFGIDGSDEKIVIMTTRPELLPACVAVMIKKDGAWSKFKGKKAVTPLFGVKVPIIEVDDDSVKEDKGTGAVMCCTFGDETDIKWWKKHKLFFMNILGKNGKMQELGLRARVAHGAREAVVIGFSIIDQNLLVDIEQFEACYKLCSENRNLKDSKEKIIEELMTKNLLLKQEKITRVVKCAERSGMPIEIIIGQQWFIKILDKKERLKAKAAECKWYPEYMKVRIDQWIDGLSWDWCISRQRFFGVKFPVWDLYVKDENLKQKISNSWYVEGKFNQKKADENPIHKKVIASIEQLPVDPAVDLPLGYCEIGVDEKENRVVVDDQGVEWLLDPETDIMDTWATSSVSPQLSSRAINEKIHLGNLDRHEKLFPADLRPQAHEIIRTWAFYTLVKSTLHQNSVPWKNLMISGWCLAADKTKMSKSKGNVVTPTALIEEKGSDIVRYWASTSHLGADTAYSEDVFKIGQKLITKLFNASKFCSMNFGELRDGAQITEAADLWILSKLQLTAKRATQEFEKFEYARAREAIEEFFWKDFCDNYLEICKVRSYGLAAEKLAGVEFNDSQKKEIEAKQQSSIATLRICLNTILKLFAPFIPHITDEIYSTIFAEEFAKTGSINSRGNWPKLGEEFFSEKFHDIGEAALAVIFEVRKFKSDNNLSMKTTVKKIVVNCEKDLSEIAEDLGNVCNAEELEFVKSGKFVEIA